MSSPKESLGPPPPDLEPRNLVLNICGGVQMMFTFIHSDVLQVSHKINVFFIISRKN